MRFGVRIGPSSTGSVPSDDDELVRLTAADADGIEIKPLSLPPCPSRCWNVIVGVVSAGLMLVAAIVSSVGAPHTSASSSSPNPPAIKFTQFWSPGHCGTRFLTELFVTSAVIGPSLHNKAKEASNRSGDEEVGSGKSLFWNEDNIYLGPHVQMANLTLSQYQQHVAVGRFLPTARPNDLDIKVSCRGGRNGCSSRVPREKVFYDDLLRLPLKQWNDEGNVSAIRRYLVDHRIPALEKVANHFHRSDGLNHLVKIGHTAIFYDLQTYQEALEDAFDVTWVRIRRKRVNVARSFAQMNKGHRPSPCDSKGGVITCPFYATSVLKLRREVWDGWTIFQQHLWFVDEVEARWRIFLSNRPTASVFTLKFTEKDDAIDPDDVDSLAAFLNVPSPRDSMRHLPHLSHISGPKMNEAEMKHEAKAYADTAPWCSQNYMDSPVDFEVDCDPDSY